MLTRISLVIALILTAPSALALGGWPAAPSASPTSALDAAAHQLDLAAATRAADPVVSAELAAERINFAAAHAAESAAASPLRGLALGEQLERVAAARSLALNGMEAAPAPVLAGHLRPSEAAFAYLATHEAKLTPDQTKSIQALDALPAAQAGALARVVDAFAAFEQAPSQGLPAMLAARGALLDATVALAAATPHERLALPPPSTWVYVPPFIAIDPVGTSNTYSDDFALVVDVGGDDTYLANNGGNGFLCQGQLGPSVCPSAALIDLGGNDQYGDPNAPRSHGVNGGAEHGAGFLVDAQGNDRYYALSYGVNGGASDGVNTPSVGFLLDAGGDDAYNAWDYGANGGGFSPLDVPAEGALIDVLGKDSIVADDMGTNGGAFGGHGFLVSAGDTNDDDSYWGNSFADNGGAIGGGVGLLVDLAGYDTYRGGNAFVDGYGAAFLYDAIGYDQYKGFSGVVHGGPGVAVLVDAQGNDQYLGQGGLVENYGATSAGLALLFDGNGTDLYYNSSNADETCDQRASSGVNCTRTAGTLGIRFDSEG